MDIADPSWAGSASKPPARRRARSLGLVSRKLTGALGDVGLVLAVHYHHVDALDHLQPADA